MKYDGARTTATSYSVTELRVHGVGGSTPEMLLGVPQVDLVAGSPAAGFYRAPAWISFGEPARNLEGYSWGGMTSRSVLRALWILLLPFALINLAGWTFPHSGTAVSREQRQSRDGRLASLFRLLALSVTLAVVAFVAIVAIEIVGVRCVSGETCLGPWYLAPWEWLADGNVATGIALGGFASAIFVFALSFIARLGQARRDLTSFLKKPGRADRTGDSSDGSADAGVFNSDPAYQTRLAGRTDEQKHELWERPDVAGRLGLAHTSASIAMIGLFSIEALASTSEVLLSSERLFLGGILVLASLSVAVLSWFGMTWHRLVLLFTTIVFGWTLIRIGLETAAFAGDPILRTSVYTVFPGMAAMFVLVIGWSAFRFASSSRGQSGAARGDETVGRDQEEAESDLFRRHATPVVLIFAALLLVVAVGAGLLGVVDSALGTNYDLIDANRYALAGLFWFVGALPVGVIAWFLAGKRSIEELTKAYRITGVTKSNTSRIGRIFRAGAVPRSRDWRFVKSVRNAEATAKITDGVFAILVGGFVGAMLIVGTLALSLLASSHPWARAIIVGLLAVSAVLIAWTIRDQRQRRAFVILVGGFVAAMLVIRAVGMNLVESMEPWSGAIVVALPALGVALIGWMIRDPSARRGFGIVWDVSTFWPRWFHPWAPPAYGEFAVPHLCARIEWLVAHKQNVVLSTHSQGCVLGAAALATLDPEVATHVRWLTHGCPLDRLYARYFPEYFDAELFAELHDKLAPGDPSWCNLWRRTDYIGGVVNIEGVDHPIRDPESGETVLAMDKRPKPSRHSNFYGTKAYRKQLTLFVRAFAVARTDATLADSQLSAPAEPADPTEL